MWCVPALSRRTKTNKLVWRVANTPPSTFHLPFVLYQKGGWMTSQLLLLFFFYLSRSLSRSLSLSLLWLRTGDCPLAMEWWEIGGDALAGLEEEVVEEELLVERSRPPPPPPPPLPVPLLLCLMPLSSMPWPLPPVTSFHNCWSSAGLRPARETERVGERKTKARWGEWRLGRYNCSPKRKPQCLVWDKSWSLNSIQQQEKLHEAAWLKAFPSVCDYLPVLLHCRPELELILHWSIKTPVLFFSAQLDTDCNLWQITLVLPSLKDFFVFNEV